MSVQAKDASRGRFRHLRYGIYDLTYENAPSAPLTLRIYSLWDGFRAICKEIHYLGRQLVDTVKLAPIEYMTYMVTTIWRGIYSAIILYWLSLLCDTLELGFRDGGVMPREACLFLAASWVSCTMVNIITERIHARSLEVLTKQFRTHFLPQLIRASLRVDILSIQDLCSIFPVRGCFGSEFPGGLFLKQQSQLVQRTLDLISQVVVLLYAISRKCSPEREVLTCLCVAHGLIWLLAPSNGIGCTSYVYWPNNLHFQRMKTLFGLAFSTQYRTNLALDGIANFIVEEYTKSAERLGDVDVLDPTPWRTGLLRDWYWDFLMDMTLDLPMAIYVLVLPACFSMSSIASMVLLQQATKSISLSIGQYTKHAPSVMDICSQAKWLYNAIDYESTMAQGTEPFPHPTDRSYDAGMKIAFRHVSLRYPGSDHQALCDVSFEILPGELVLVVGTNGSGKSSILKLLARLFDPSAGEILIDDLPLVGYDMDQLRDAMAFQSQSPVVYPVPVKENISFGLPPAFKLAQEHVEKAARMGGCSEWISRLGDGYDTQLQPSFDISHGWIDGVYGYPSEALKEALTRHRGHFVSISDGQKQRLATARTFMRINNRTTRLVVVDEATSSLDPVAERDILSEFRKLRAGKTVVLVTHRFHHLAHEADRILCIKDGRVVENGTHAQLIDVNGDYAALYRAQVEWIG